MQGQDMILGYITPLEYMYLLSSLTRGKRQKLGDRGQEKSCAQKVHIFGHFVGSKKTKPMTIVVLVFFKYAPTKNTKNWTEIQYAQMQN